MRKRGDVHSAIGIRFDVAFADAARLSIERELTVAFAHVTSWTARPSAGRSYVRAVGDDAALRRIRLTWPEARVTSPPDVALAVRPHASADLARLERAFLGAGAPAGVVDAVRDGDAVAIEFDAARSSLGLVVAIVDACAGRAREIVPLRPLEDDVLATFAAVRLADPALDASRLIEPYVERLARAGAT